MNFVILAEHHYVQILSDVRTRYSRRCYLKANKLSKRECTRKVE